MEWLVCSVPDGRMFLVGSNELETFIGICIMNNEPFPYKIEKSFDNLPDAVVYMDDIQFANELIESL